MLLTGELIEAGHRARLGACEPGRARGSGLDAEVGGARRRASPRPALRTVALGKHAFYAQAERDEDGAYDLTGPW